MCMSMIELLLSYVRLRQSALFVDRTAVAGDVVCVVELSHSRVTYRACFLLFSF